MGKQKTAETENPYLNARRTWNDQFSNLASSTRLWQVVGIVSLLVAMASVGGVVHIGGQSKFVPYIIEVDTHGEARAVGRVAERVPVNAQHIKASLAQWITDARTVTPDRALQKKAILAVYAKLGKNDPANAKMSQYHHENSPFARASREGVHVEISSVLKQTLTTWQMEWNETVRDRRGQIQSGPTPMRALITIYLEKTTARTTEEQILKNPLGIYVRDFSWSRVQ